MPGEAFISSKKLKEKSSDEIFMLGEIIEYSADFTDKVKYSSAFVLGVMEPLISSMK